MTNQIKGGNIFMVNPDKTLTEITEIPLKLEKPLQDLIQEYPEILAGDQIAPEQPRIWVHLARELSVPHNDNAAEDYSLDHLVVAQDAIPTLVEDKRGDDTRIRREVVGQMLDYAANIVKYWPEDKRRAIYDINNSALEDKFSKKDPEEKARFWQEFEENLKRGILRLIFVADSIPFELRTVIEFLNQKMVQDVQIFAIEIRSFGENIEADKDSTDDKEKKIQVIVPYLVAGGDPTNQNKMDENKIEWTEDKFFDEVEKRSPEFKSIVDKLFTRLYDLSLIPTFPSAPIDNIGRKRVFWTVGQDTPWALVINLFFQNNLVKVEIDFKNMHRAPLDTIEGQADVLARMKDTIKSDKSQMWVAGGQPNFEISYLKDPNVFENFINNVVKYIIDQYETSAREAQIDNTAGTSSAKE
jgi:hypothetical protein